jgi:hypothetical protein
LRDWGLASTLAVFQPGSTSPAAILFDAVEQFDRRSPKADEAIRSIKMDLADAVDTCVEAAGLESDPMWQKKLLKVIVFPMRLSLPVRNSYILSTGGDVR